MIWITAVISVFSILFILLSALLFEKIQNVAQFKKAIKLMFGSWVLNMFSFVFLDMIQMRYLWFYRIFISISYIGSLLLLAIAIYLVTLSFIEEKK
ncbi:MAG: hypothetical protein FD122_2835 [Stygiobacter sp.]|nr:MAG: hypothetical protein FD122_2835 [Stygiobacter sp.]KAF0213220.1 MAG: hypothetical protein FD178_2933 [Ignavibacteria bacterium]